VIAAVDTKALLQLMWAAPLAVLTVTVAYGLVINGFAGMADARRDGRGAATAGYAALALAGGALFLAAIVLGLIIMISKD